MLAIVLGTRPELIKTAPVMLEAERRGVPFAIIHTGQHYTEKLDAIFFEELGLPPPAANLHVGSHPAPKQIGRMLEGLHAALESLKPSVVMVQGDTNSVLAGALAADKMNIPVAHLEAGLRSDDWTMPEEANRVLADRVSKWLFCPTEVQRDRLRREGIVHAGVAVVGNTIVDAAEHYVNVAKDKSSVLARLGVEGKPFALLTMHRPNNVDDPERLRAMLRAIGEAATLHGLAVVFPIHPRTAATMKRNGVQLGEPFITTEPLGYLDLLRLQSNASIVLTDSGGIQEEACILRVPSVTLRPNTERPETLKVGASMLCHEADGKCLADAMRAQMAIPRTWENPFGDGKTAKRVMDILVDAGIV